MLTLYGNSTMNDCIYIRALLFAMKDNIAGILVYIGFKLKDWKFNINFRSKYLQ